MVMQVAEAKKAIDLATLRLILAKSNEIYRRIIAFYEEQAEQLFTNPEAVTRFCETVSSMQHSAATLDKKISLALDENPSAGTSLQQELQEKRQLLQDLYTANQEILRLAEDKKLLLHHDLRQLNSARNATRGYFEGTITKVTKPHLNKTL